MYLIHAELLLAQFMMIKETPNEKKAGPRQPSLSNKGTNYLYTCGFNIWQALAFQPCDQILCRHQRHLVAGCCTCTGNVRHDDHIVQCKQRMIQGEWFRVSDVQACRENAFGFKAS